MTRDAVRTVVRRESRAAGSGADDGPAQIAMVCASRDGVDGILDYATGLADAMTRLHGARVDLVVRRGHTWSVRTCGRDGGRARDVAGLAAAVRHSDGALLHYNPYSWGRWGVAPRLAPELAYLRARRPELALGVIVHEPYVDIVDARTAATGLAQRWQLHGVLRSATAGFASTEVWTADLRRHMRAPVAQLPICSNLPDRRAQRDATRERLGIQPPALAVALFGMRHPARLIGHIEAAVRRIADAIASVVLLNLGADPPALRELSRSVRVIAPGRLDAAAVADHLAAADLFLAPFGDGVSARRTTVMAALQHGLAVLGTDGPLTDEQLRVRPDALTLTPAPDAGAFAAAALRLAGDHERRRRQGAAGRELYASGHDWPIACRVALDGLGLTG